MKETGIRNGAFGAETFGFSGLKAAHWNLTEPALYEHALRAKEGELAFGGALVAETGVHTGRSPKDKFIVRDALTDKTVWWDNNGAITTEQFQRLHDDFIAHAKGKALFAQDLYGGADRRYRISTRVYTELAWHSLFIRTLLIRPERGELKSFVPDLTIFDLPSFKADPERHGVRSETIIAIDFSRKIVLIGGTSYAGEMKKSVFTTLNYFLPNDSVMPMHCSANVGPAGDTALFFGLSGTGKTTLSADPERHLIGDDEHGWGASGVFNIEGGCYAKVIHLSPTAEPEIYRTTHTFGTILENVAIDDQGIVDLDDASKTENTRAAYKLEQIANALPTKMAGHPQSVIFLTADAFGILPPIAKLSNAQALYFFLSGFTAKLAGTEIGVTEPQPTFSTCFGQPFLPQHPKVYARMLDAKLEEHGSTVWLLNTGWTGGPFGEGERMPIAATRTMLSAALSGALDNSTFRVDALFGFEVPTTVPGVDAKLLDPRSTWRDPEEYDRKARELAQMFADNFAKRFGDVGESVQAAGPNL